MARFTLAAFDHIGFTGTRRGLTAKQQFAILHLLEGPARRWFAHGDCIGADAESHAIALDRNLSIAIYPPTIQKYRAFCQGARYVHTPLAYLVRNRIIVRASDVVIAAPGEAEEVIRSGTWSTYRYAGHLARPRVLVLPDGTMTIELGAQNGP